MNAIRRWARWFVGDGMFVRYLITGAGISLLDLGLYTLLSVGLRWHVVLANVISTIIAVSVSYLLNRRFVFRASGNSWRTFFSFAGVTLVTGLLVQSLVIWGLVSAAAATVPSWDAVYVLTGAKVIAMGIGAVANYLGYRLTFHERA